ncbi:MAG: TIGR00730 family Rossman fold protein [Polyangiaceae bacterium]
MSSKRSFRAVAVYCGSSNRVDSKYLDVATHVGTELASRGVGVVYGGGSVGLMGAVADGALQAGGRVDGVITDKLMDMELGHPRLTELIVTKTMGERKMKMASLADAFIGLPGGWGTLEEVFEVVTLTQLEYHRKPVGLLNAGGYYDHLIAFLDHAAGEGFIRPSHRGLISCASTIEGLLGQLEVAELPGVAGLF